MATVAEKLQEIRTLLISSAAIDSFCQSSFGKNLTVFLGADVRNLPEIDNYPYLLLDRGSSTFTDYQNSFADVTSEFYIFICIRDEQLEQPDGRGTIYRGVKQIDRLSQLVRQEICKAHPEIEFTKEDPVSMSETLPLREYPVYVSLLTGEIRHLREQLQ